MPDRPFAFVLMPISSEFDDVYRLGIQAAAHEKGVVAERVDEQKFSESILERIYRQIKAADIIIADMTGRNPNVFYEVGFAHAHDKICILLTQSTDDIPFDLKHHRHIVYGSSIHKLKTHLIGDLDWAIAEVERKASSPVTIEFKAGYGDLNSTNSNANIEVEAVLDLHNYTKRKSPELESIYIHTGAGWQIHQGKELCPSISSEFFGGGRKHFVRPPLPRLSPGTWAQLTLTLSKQIWSKYVGQGEKPKNYTAKGNIMIEVYTSDGKFDRQIYLNVDCDEIPF